MFIAIHVLLLISLSLSLSLSLLSLSSLSPSLPPLSLSLSLHVADIQVDQYYPTFLNMAKALMEGNIDCSSYEDTCREMFGVHAYVVFTVDRLVQNIVRQVQCIYCIATGDSHVFSYFPQLHAMVADDSCSSVLEQYTCFVEGLSSEGPGYVAMETSYQKKMETSLADENCFKVVMVY